MKANSESNLTTEHGHGGRSAVTLESQLDEARQVVGHGGSTRAVLAAHTARRLVGAAIVQQLHLTERARSRHHRLAHILEQTRTRRLDGGQVRVGLAVVLGLGPGGRAEGALGERATRTAARRERIDDVLEGGQGHEVALLDVNLLDTGLERGHLFIPVL